MVFILCEETEEIIGADFPTGIDGEKFAGFDPEHSHLELPGDCGETTVFACGGSSGG